MQFQITLSSLSELEQLVNFLAGIKTPAVVDNSSNAKPNEAKDNAKKETVQVIVIEPTEAKDDAKTEAKTEKAEAKPTNATNTTEAPTIIDENEPISVRIRRVIQTTRERLGDDGSDAVLRRGVNTELKNIALALGFDKPSAINTEEAYESFKTDANCLIVENGKVKQQLPF